MNTHLSEEFSIARFETSDVDPGRFDHEAHIYVAWLYMNRYERDEAIRRFDAALQRFTRKIGASDKYNAMITWLFLLLIDERVQDGEDWSVFRARNSDLFDGRPRQAAA